MECHTLKRKCKKKKECYPTITCTYIVHKEDSSNPKCWVAYPSDIKNRKKQWHFVWLLNLVVVRHIMSANKHNKSANECTKGSNQLFSVASSYCLYCKMHQLSGIPSMSLTPIETDLGFCCSVFSEDDLFVCRNCSLFRWGDESWRRPFDWTVTNPLTTQGDQEWVRPYQSGRPSAGG